MKIVRSYHTPFAGNSGHVSGKTNGSSNSPMRTLSIARGKIYNAPLKGVSSSISKNPGKKDFTRQRPGIHIIDNSGKHYHVMGHIPITTARSYHAALLKSWGGEMNKGDKIGIKSNFNGRPLMTLPSLTTKKYNYPLENGKDLMRDDGGLADNSTMTNRQFLPRTMTPEEVGNHLIQSGLYKGSIDNWRALAPEQKAAYLDPNKGYRYTYDPKDLSSNPGGGRYWRNDTIPGNHLPNSVKYLEADALKKFDKSTYKYDPTIQKDWGGAFSGMSQGAGMGASIGTIFGPEGTVIGGAIGGLAGAIFGNVTSNNANRIKKRQAQAIENAKLTNKKNTDAINNDALYSNDSQQLGQYKELNNEDLYTANGGMIKPSHKGRFTAYKARTGKTTSEALHSNNAHVRSMAQFAVNAKKFHHAMGGNLRLPPTPDAEFENTGYTSNMKFAKTPLNRYYASGGNLRLPPAEHDKLSNGAELLTNPQGGTNGSHEQGDNIPISKGGQTSAIAEPGEVITKDANGKPYVISKRNGLAQKYMALEAMKRNVGKEKKESINKEQRMIPSQNEQIRRRIEGNKGIPEARCGRRLDAGGGLGASGITSMITGALGTVGNMLESNKALKYQTGLINQNIADAQAFTPVLNKAYTARTKVDVGDQISAANSGYNSDVNRLSNITDPGLANALKNNANINRMNSLNSIYGNKARMEQGINEQNINTINQTNASNTSILNNTALYKLNALTQGREQLGNAESARVANDQSAMKEFNQEVYNQQALKNMSLRYKGMFDNTGKKFGGKIKSSRPSRIGNKINVSKRTLKAA
jgi:hypothetical protein